MAKRKYKMKKYRRKAKRGVRGLVKLIKRVDTQQEFKRSPMLYREYDFSGALTGSNILPNYYSVCTPFGPMPMGIGVEQQNQRLNDAIYPQLIKGELKLIKDNANVPQSFRVYCLRWTGEEPFLITAASPATSPVFEITSSSGAHQHLVNFNEQWSVKKFSKNQVEVLMDRKFYLNDISKDSMCFRFKVMIRRKLTFETQSGVDTGAGNIWFVICSNLPYNVEDANIVGYYKDLQ